MSNPTRRVSGNRSEEAPLAKIRVSLPAASMQGPDPPRALAAAEAGVKEFEAEEVREIIPFAHEDPL